MDPNMERMIARKVAMLEQLVSMLYQTRFLQEPDPIKAAERYSDHTVKKISEKPAGGPKEEYWRIDLEEEFRVFWDGVISGLRKRKGQPDPLA